MEFCRLMFSPDIFEPHTMDTELFLRGWLFAFFHFPGVFSGAGTQSGYLYRGGCAGDPENHGAVSVCTGYQSNLFCKFMDCNLVGWMDWKLDFTAYRGCHWLYNSSHDGKCASVWRCYQGTAPAMLWEQRRNGFLPKKSQNFLAGLRRFCSGGL